MAAGENILTYHVVPRFDIAAEGGPLALGTIVSDLKRLVPLNRGFHVAVTDVYPPVAQTDYTETLGKVRRGNLEAWIKALGLPASASANMDASSSIEGTVSCDSIVTTYFDPDLDYAKKCVAQKPVQDWLEAKGRKVDLYLVTGLKVAMKLKFNKSSESERHASAGVSASEPLPNAVKGGLRAEIAGEKRRDIAFSVDDIVIGYRVNRYSCERRLFRTERGLGDGGVVIGNMMGHGRSQREKPETDVEAVPIPEEADTREEARAAGDNECWVY